MNYAWLKALRQPVPDALVRPLEVAEFEARQVTEGARIVLEPVLGEGSSRQRKGGKHCQQTFHLSEYYLVPSRIPRR